MQQQEINWMRSEMKALQELITHKDGLISHYEQIAGIVLNSEEQLIDAAKKLYEQDTIIDSMRAKEEIYRVEFNKMKSAMEMMQHENN
jgi:flagellar capping protein FliD